MRSAWLKGLAIAAALSVNVEGASAQTALSYLSIIDNSRCFYPAEGAAKAIWNRSSTVRIFVRIQVDSSPASYPVLDMNFKEVKSPSQLEIYVLPGKLRHFGCEGSAITGTGAVARNTYSIKYAASVAPMKVIPDTDRPTDFTRWVIFPSVPNGRPCGKYGYYALHNSHMIRSLEVTLTGVLGKTAPETLVLIPTQYYVTGCASDHIKVISSVFK